MKNTIVSAAWLHENLSNPKLIILDASASSNATNQNYIPHSIYFNLNGVFSDLTSNLPNTMPSASQFEKECQLLGINSDSEIVVYDNKGIYYSPRVWWMFKTMGHQNVKVLDGGLPHWIEQAYPSTTKLTQATTKGNFKAVFDKNSLVNYRDVEENLSFLSFLLVDARSEGRFQGIEEEPRKELQSGNIPMSINVPYTEVLENGKFKSIEELTKVLYLVEMDTRPIVFSCGSGLTACIVLLATALISEHEMAIYDGSWTEWATKQKLFA